jgi:hypothetical protein
MEMGESDGKAGECLGFREAAVDGHEQGGACPVVGYPNEPRLGPGDAVKMVEKFVCWSHGVSGRMHKLTGRSVRWDVER